MKMHGKHSPVRVRRDLIRHCHISSMEHALPVHMSTPLKDERCGWPRLLEVMLRRCPLFLVKPACDGPQGTARQ
jgi:hypothetical protein